LQILQEQRVIDVLRVRLDETRKGGIVDLKYEKEQWRTNKRKGRRRRKGDARMSPCKKNRSIIKKRDKTSQKQRQGETDDLHLPGLENGDMMDGCLCSRK
jgi:hypothetical protein